MKLLRSFTIGQHMFGRWALLAGIIFWLSGSIASPAHAESLNYEIDNPGVFSGTFSLDESRFSTPITDWMIFAHYPPPDGIVLYSFSNSRGLSGGSGSDGLTRANLRMGGGNLDKELFDFSVTYQTQMWAASAQLGDGSPITQSGHYSLSQPVPEPAVAVLLATGLLVLAGSRWLPRRGARQQLG